MNQQRATAGYPLSTLFFAIAATAVLISLMAPVFTSARNGEVAILMECVGWSAMLGIVGAILGIVIGLYHYRRLRGVGWGVLSGFVTGTCLGPVAVSPDFDQVTQSCVIGGGLMMLIGAFYRLNAHRRPRVEKAG